MIWIARLFAMPMGAFVGVIAWALLYLAIFDSITLWPLSRLALTLSPGAILGLVLAYIYPGIFLWFWSWETGGDTHVEITNLEVDDTSHQAPKAANLDPDCPDKP